MTKPGRPLKPADTPFARWMDEMGFGSLKQAADALGMSESRVKDYRRGSTMRREGPQNAEIDLAVRLAMAALKEGIKPYN